MSKLSVMVFIATVLVASVVVVTIPAANALTTRDFSGGFNDNHITARYGNTLVCGDHMCVPGEWDKLVSSLSAAQRGEQFGRNATSTSIPATPPTTPPTMPTGVTPKVCENVKAMLSSAGVSANLVSQVMADLGCS